MLDYPCAKFGDCIFSRFGFNVWTNRIIDFINTVLTVKLLINAPEFIRTIGKYPRHLVESRRARVVVVRVESN